jgi:hypothetical protein
MKSARVPRVRRKERSSSPEDMRKGDEEVDVDVDSEVNDDDDGDDDDDDDEAKGRAGSDDVNR